MKIDIKSLLLIALLAGVGAAFFLFPSAGGLKAAPNTTVTTIDGKTLNLKELQGKPYLLTFWSTDCVTCVEEIPQLVQLNKTLQGTGFNIISVAMPYDKPDNIRAMRDRKQMPFSIAYDKDGSIGKAFGGVQVTPTNFLVSPDGKIVLRQMGLMDMPKLEQRIRSMLPS